MGHEGHVFFDKINDKILKIGFDGFVDWSLDTETFEPYHINYSPNYHIGLAGWYRGEIHLGNNLLPSYGNTLWKSALVMIDDDPAQGTYLRNPELAEIKVYPNPASDFIRINSITPHKYRIEIFDLGSKKVYDSHVPVSLKEYEINTHIFKVGIYSVVLTSENDIQKITLMKK